MGRKRFLFSLLAVLLCQAAFAAQRTDRLDIGTSSVTDHQIGMSSVVFNERGQDIDFRVESDTNINAIYVDASTDRVGIMQAAPAYTLDVYGSMNVDQAAYFQNNVEVNNNLIFPTSGRLLLSNGAYNSPALSFFNHESSINRLAGFYLDPDDTDIVHFASGNWTNTGSDTDVRGDYLTMLPMIPDLDSGHADVQVGVGQLQPGAVLEVVYGRLWGFESGVISPFEIGNNGGNWYIETASPLSGKCSLRYDDSQTDTTVDVKVVAYLRESATVSFKYEIFTNDNDPASYFEFLINGASQFTASTPSGPQSTATIALSGGENTLTFQVVNTGTTTFDMLIDDVVIQYDQSTTPYTQDTLYVQGRAKFAHNRTADPNSFVLLGDDRGSGNMGIFSKSNTYTAYLAGPSYAASFTGDVLQQSGDINTIGTMTIGSTSSTGYSLGFNSSSTIGVRASSGASSGASLTMQAGNSGSGTDLGGGTLNIQSGKSTGDAGGVVNIDVARSGQGTGTTARTQQNVAQFGTSSIIFNENSYDYDFRVESDGNANMLFVDASTNRIGIGNSSPAYTLDVTGAIRSNNGGGVIASSNGTFQGTNGSYLLYPGAAGGTACSYILSSNAASSPLVLRAAASQTANILTTQDTSGNSLTFVSASGGLTVNEQGSNTDSRIEGDTDANLLMVKASNDSVGIGTATPTYKFDVSGSIRTTGTLTGTSTTNIGWTTVSAANQACDTTCTYGAVFGFDTGGATIVGPSDATADVCVCAGPS